MTGDELELIEVGDYVRYTNQKMTHRVVRIAGFVYYLESGNYGRLSWSYRSGITLYQKHRNEEAA